MIAIIFEVEPRDGMLDPYLDLAAELRPRLEKIDGFISVERFASLTTPGKYLSLSFWRDEAAVADWRRQAHHRIAQHKGRTEMFLLAHVLRDYARRRRRRTRLPSERRRGGARRGARVRIGQTPGSACGPSRESRNPGDHRTRSPLARG